MTMYSGDEFYGDDITSGPIPDDDYEFLFDPYDGADKPEDDEVVDREADEVYEREQS